jgi:hypothetical protein
VASRPDDEERARRRSGLWLFAGGVATVLALGGLFAAVDLWGGIHTLGLSPRTLGSAMLLGAALLVAGVWRWLGSWPRELRLRRALQATGALALLATLLGGGLFGYYALRLGVSAEICARADCETTRAGRERLLDEGLGPLFPVIDPAYACIELERQRREHRARGACPTVLLDDTPCRCGRERWDPASSPRCPTGRTTCQSRGAGPVSLGCASDHAARALSACGP